MSWHDEVEKRKEEVLAALRAWNQTDDSGLLQDWLLVQYSDTQPQSLAHQRLATNRVLLRGIDKIGKQKPKWAQFLRARYLDGLAEDDVIEQVGISGSTIYRWQRQVPTRLTTILLAEEAHLRQTVADTQSQILPKPTYDTLVGVSTFQDELVAKLLSEEAPYLFLLTGLGGIGKTALVDSVVRQVIATFCFRRIVWVSVQDSEVPESVWEQVVRGVGEQVGGESAETIHNALHLQRTLIIIDNIETKAVASYVSQQCQTWANPAKIILTSRARPDGLTQLFVQEVGELSAENTLTLIRNTAQTNNWQDLLTATDDQLRPIYDHTGGHPLAVKIVCGMAFNKPLDVVLADLPLAKLVATQELYWKIYWRAWESLTAPAKKLLTLMPLFPAGKPASLQKILKIDSEQIFSEITDELLALSLLIKTGTTFSPRYTIHALTNQFLQTEIIKWKQKTTFST